MIVVMLSSTVKGAVKFRPNQITQNCWNLLFCYVTLLYKWVYLLRQCHVHTCPSSVLTFMCVDFKWLRSICTYILLVVFVYVLVCNFNYLFVTSFLFYLFLVLFIFSSFISPSLRCPGAVTGLPMASFPNPHGLGAVLTAYTAPPPTDLSAEGKNGEEPLPHRDTDAPSAPRELKAVIQSTRFVTLSWNPPEKVTGPILTYSVFYRQEGSER